MSFATGIMAIHDMTFVICFLILRFSCVLSEDSADAVSIQTIVDLEDALSALDHSRAENKYYLIKAAEAHVGLDTYVRERRDTSVSAKQKQELLDSHNYARSTVDPPASNMLEMKWDDSLASNAQKYAEKCLWKHSDSTSRKSGTPFRSVGENLFLTSAGSLDATMAVNAWNNEKEFYSYDFMHCETNRMCGHYTQVVWAKSEFVGCGIHTCKDGFKTSANSVISRGGTILVCVYGPAGNYMGVWPYQLGKTCSKCPDGYDNCVDNLCSGESQCRTDTCKNGGTCKTSGSSYTCTCPIGFTGKNCENKVPECHSTPCKNGGRCRESGSSYVCDCRTGFSGTNCQNKVSPCQSGPCKNGGTCKVSGGSSYTCKCRSGYVGTNCQKKVSACDSNPCKNGGKCTTSGTSYKCACQKGYTGKQCQTKVFLCDPNPCLNGGTCNADGSCSCPPGVLGSTCEIKGHCPANAIYHTSAGLVQCFWKMLEKSTYDDASEYCEKYGGTLAIIPNKETNDFVKITYPFDVFHGVWIGVNDKDTEGVYKNSNGKVQNYVDWAKGSSFTEPTGADSEDCVVFRYNHWFDESCQSKRDILCSKRAPPCEPNPCHNGGTCTDSGDSYTCKCTQQFTGKNCEVKSEFFCSFEPGEECFLQETVGDNFDWTLRKGNTSTKNSGPEQAFQGNYYKYIEASPPRKFGDVAWLRSGLLPDTPLCMTFAYHMYGASMGSLNIYHFTNSGFKNLFSTSGDKGVHWLEAMVDIPADPLSMVYIEGIRGSAYTGDIAIDDVRFRRGECDDVAVTCTFEQNECFLVQDELDNFNWRRQKGPTPTPNTGPEKAFEGDYYLYMEASGKRRGYIARMISNIVFPDKPRCLVFDYHMYGAAVGTLRVGLYQEDRLKEELFSRSGDQGDAWQKAVIDIRSMYQLQLQIEGQRANGYLGDIAIDNVIISPGRCDCSYKPCNNGGKCVLNGDKYRCLCPYGFKGETCNEVERGTLTCPFDTDCFLKNSNTKGLKWEISDNKDDIQSATPMSLFKGKFGYLCPINVESKESKAALTSKGTIFDKRIRCLSFSYHLFGDDECQLRIYSGHTDWSVFHWSKPGVFGNQWIPAKVEIPALNDLELRIEGEASFDSKCFIAVDEIKLVAGSC